MFFACLKNNYTISMLWRPQPGNPQLGHKRIWRISTLKRIQNSPTLWCFRKPIWCLDDLLTNSKSSTFSENLRCLDDFPSRGFPLPSAPPWNRTEPPYSQRSASKMSAPLPGSPRQKMVLPEPDISTASPCRRFPPSDLCGCRNLSDYDEPTDVAMAFQDVHETHVR